MLFTERQGLAVWLHSLKNVRQLRRYGNIHYVSKKMKYVILYCDQAEAESVAERLRSMPFVKKIELSMRPYVSTEYQNAKPDKAKEYDYRMGI